MHGTVLPYLRVYKPHLDFYVKNLEIPYKHEYKARFSSNIASRKRGRLIFEASRINFKKTVPAVKRGSFLLK
jgi:hypothetical protein